MIHIVLKFPLINNLLIAFHQFVNNFSLYRASFLIVWKFLTKDLLIYCYIFSLFSIQLLIIKDLIIILKEIILKMTQVEKYNFHRANICALMDFSRSLSLIILLQDSIQGLLLQFTAKILHHLLLILFCYYFLPELAKPHFLYPRVIKSLKNLLFPSKILKCNFIFVFFTYFGGLKLIARHFYWKLFILLLI